MSQRKIGKSWWVDFRFKFTRYRKKSPLNTAQGAKEYEATLRSRLGRGEPLEPPKQQTPQTFAEFAAEWFETYVKTNNKPSEQRAKRMILDRHLVPAFGRLHIGAIDVAAVERFKAEGSACGLHPKTVNNHLAVLRRCLNTAEEWGCLPSVPKFRPLKVPPPPLTLLQPHHVELLVDATDQPQVRAMILLALHTGMRIGEIRALSWSAVNLTRRIITVERSVVRGHVSSPKSNRIRHIPVSAPLAAALGELPKTAEVVFPDPEGAGMVSEDRATKLLRRTCRDAGVAPVGWHALRHTFGTDLIARGASASAVQALLGHSTLAMTERYIHVSPGMLRSAIDLLSCRPAAHSLGNGWATDHPGGPLTAGPALRTFAN